MSPVNYLGVAFPEGSSTAAAAPPTVAGGVAYPCIACASPTSAEVFFCGPDCRAAHKAGVRAFRPRPEPPCRHERILWDDESRLVRCASCRATRPGAKAQGGPEVRR